MCNYRPVHGSPGIYENPCRRTKKPGVGEFEEIQIRILDFGIRIFEKANIK
jgi:hypothetical protein